MTKRLTLILLMLSIALSLFASGYNILQVISGMQQGHRFTRPVWTEGTYIRMPFASNWEDANNDIYIYSVEHPSGVFWNPSSSDNIATDYVEVP